MINCPYCPQSFLRGAGLGNHIAAKHPGKPFKHGAGSTGSQEPDGRRVSADRVCPHCEETISGPPSAYANHIRAKHPDKMKQRKQKDLNGATVAFCPRCGCNIAGVSTALVVAERMAR